MTTCAECDVALVDTPPPEPAPPPEREPTDPGEALEYDLTDWDQEARSSLEWMLSGRAVRFEWEPPGVLVVAERDEEVVDGFIDYLAAGPPDDEPVEVAEVRPWEIDVDEFYDADPRRRASDEVEFGMEWTDRAGLAYELSWIEDTGELFLMTADRGVEVEVLGVWLERAAVEELLDGWGDAITEPHSVEWIRARIARGPTSADDADEPDAGDGGNQWWTPPAAIGWITPELEGLFRAYFEYRANRQPDTALDAAMKEVLDQSLRDRLTEFFQGEMDVVYGEGTGDQARVGLRDALERRFSGLDQ